MKKSSLVLAIILVAASIIITERKTHAWYSYGKPGDWPIHTGLALLSLENVMQSDEFEGLKWKEIFDELIDGANAPDRHKRWLDHEATFRIEDTLCASVKAKKNLEALNRLAIGFHYLSDNGDATEGSYKSELAEIAYKMLFEEDDTNIDSKYKVRWGFRKSPLLKRQYFLPYDWSSNGGKFNAPVCNLISGTKTGAGQVYQSYKTEPKFGDEFIKYGI